MARTKLDGVGSNVQGVSAKLAGPPTAEGDAVRANTRLLVYNGNVGSLTVTLQTGGTADSLAVADPTIVIPTTEGRLIGPFPDVFPQTSGADEGWVYVDYSVQANVTRLAIAGS